MQTRATRPRCVLPASMPSRLGPPRHKNGAPAPVLATTRIRSTRRRGRARAFGLRGRRGWHSGNPRRACHLQEGVVPVGLVARPVGLPPDLSQLRAAALAGPHEGQEAARPVVRRPDVVEAIVRARRLHVRETPSAGGLFPDSSESQPAPTPQSEPPSSR